MKYLIFVIFTCFSQQANAEQTLPHDVNLFIQNADTCYHFAGEISGDNSKRDKEVQQNMRKPCNAADRQYKQLMKKYKHNTKLIETINATDYVQNTGYGQSASN
ncbi:MAG TPA: hypothetical protein PL131_07635 [Methylotenera sp.]|nr:hypothetical protein [Methylotenera sp.]HPH05733.1 hypothetical protein [Methylotenera sp.]HPN01104.1 hypothetical protein [Methylotenera sp.]